MIAVELVKDRKTREPFTPADPYPGKVSDACLEQGVMLRTIVNKLIISPPLTFTREHVDEAVAVLDRALARNATPADAILCRTDRNALPRPPQCMHDDEQGDRDLDGDDDLVE